MSAAAAMRLTQFHGEPESTHVTVTAHLDSVRAANVIAAPTKRCRTVLTERCRYITK